MIFFPKPPHFPVIFIIHLKFNKFSYFSPFRYIYYQIVTSILS
nr:MAG TPA: hypothetical protein [Caudoviricetes sp.]